MGFVVSASSPRCSSSSRSCGGRLAELCRLCRPGLPVGTSSPCTTVTWATMIGRRPGIIGSNSGAAATTAAAVQVGPCPEATIFSPLTVLRVFRIGKADGRRTRRSGVAGIKADVRSTTATMARPAGIWTGPRTKRRGAVYTLESGVPPRPRRILCRIL